MALIAPSLVAADFAQLGKALGIIKAAGAPMVHVDVMDGHFTRGLTVGQPVIGSLRKATDLVLDVHLMIERPERFVTQFMDAGAERVSIQIEATPHVGRVLELIRARGGKAGVALNPATAVESVAEVVEEIDFLTILTAEPDVREQPFLARSVARVRASSRLREERHLSFALQVEGGIGFGHVEGLVRAGADILVVGSAIFHNDDPEARLRDLARLALGACQTSSV